MAHIVIAYTFVAHFVIASALRPGDSPEGSLPYSYGLCGYGLSRYGLYGHGPFGYGLHGYGLRAPSVPLP